MCFYGDIPYPGIFWALADKRIDYYSQRQVVFNRTTEAALQVTDNLAVLIDQALFIVYSRILFTYIQAYHLPHPVYPYTGP
jgi:hypothetical protein